MRHRMQATHLLNGCARRGRIPPWAPTHQAARLSQPQVGRSAARGGQLGREGQARPRPPCVGKQAAARSTGQRPWPSSPRLRGVLSATTGGCAPAAVSGPDQPWAASPLSAGTLGAPSVPISSGQMRCQSSGRRSQRQTLHLVALSIETAAAVGTGRFPAAHALSNEA